MSNLTLAAINQRNTNFWSKEALHTQMRASDPAILESALELMNLFRRVGFSVNQIPSLDYFLYVAEQNRKTSLKHFARMGGKAQKPNALQKVIEEIVREDPNITEPQLLKKLAGDAGAGVVEKIDKPSDRVLECDPLYIHYFDEDGRPRTAPLSGLKDRLSRAKRKIRNSH